MKRAIQLTFKLILVAILLLTTTCTKDPSKVTNLKIGSTSIVTDNSATVGAEFIDVSGNITAFGHCWATSSNPDVTDGKTNNSGTAKKGDYTSNLTGLSPNTKYYVRAYAMDNGKAVYSDHEISFTTLEAKYINITLPTATDNWTKGSTQNIIWMDNIDENVLIELYKDGTLLEEIESSTESDGRYNWPLDNALISGTDYSIKISSVDDTSISDQTGQFEISETPNISITVPTTGTDWQKGSSQTITWTDNLDENVKIELFKAGIYDSDIAASAASDGSKAWIVPTNLDADNDYTIKITSVDDESISDESANFTISEILGITITSPTNSSSWQMGNTENITWNDNISENVKIELYKSETKNSDINTSTESDGFFEWNISTSLVAGTDYKIKMTSINDAGISDESEDFEISAIPNITITTPISGTEWQMGSNQIISWTDNIEGNVDIELFKGGIKVSANGDIALNTASDNSESWTIPSNLAEGTDYTIKVTSVDEVSVFDESGQFTLSEAPYITITSPTTGDHWLGLDAGNITWTSNITGNVHISLYNGSNLVEVIDGNYGNSGSYTWNSITDGLYGTNFKIRITSLEISGFYIESNTFMISESNGSTGTVVDIYTLYLTIKIGKQWWMAENLNVGNRIDGVNNQTDNGYIEKYCYANDEANCNIYGGLYQWNEMMQYSTIEMTRGICPDGWHLPSDNEWKELEMYLGMSQAEADGTNPRGTNEGSKLAGNAALWTDGDLETNAEFGTSGFTALPGGYFGSGINNRGYWWSSTVDEYSNTYAWRRRLFNTSSQAWRYTDDKSEGQSVRCVRDWP